MISKQFLRICFCVSQLHISNKQLKISRLFAILQEVSNRSFIFEPILSQLLLQQALEIKEHQGRFILRFRLDEILEVTFLVEPDGRDICINGYEPTTN